MGFRECIEWFAGQTGYCEQEGDEPGEGQKVETYETFHTATSRKQRGSTCRSARFGGFVKVAPPKSAALPLLTPLLSAAFASVITCSMPSWL